MRGLKTCWVMTQACALTLALAASDAASAALVVSPLRQNVVVKPGRVEKFYLTIANSVHGRNDATQSAHLQVMDFQTTEEGGLTFHPVGTVRNSASPWITLSKEDIILDPGKGEKIECTIRTPAGATGEYYSSIMVDLVSKHGPKGIHIDYRIASGIFVTVEGRSFPKQADVARFEMTWPAAPALPVEGIASLTKVPPAKTEPVKVQAVVKNIGRVLFDASADLRILTSEGRLLFKSPMKTGRACVLPGDTRLFQSIIERPLPSGEYVMRVDFDYGSPLGRVSRRTTLTVTPEQETQLAKIASDLAKLRKAKIDEAPVRPTPEKLAAVMPAGAFRMLKLSLKNFTDEDLRCTVELTATENAGIPSTLLVLDNDRFVIGGGQTRPLVMTVTMPPAGEAVPVYRATLVVKSVGPDERESRTVIPVELKAVN